ncbi:MAG: amidohydrolase [Phycisphaerales bacterium JB059]
MTPRREAHAHIAHLGRTMGMVDLTACPSRETMLEQLGARAREMDDAGDPGWVLAHAARPEAWTDPRWPDADELTGATGDRPCLAWCFDAHALVLNHAALRACGFSATTPDPPGGIIDRDPTGACSGLLLESAATLAWSRVPEPTPEQRAEHVHAALTHLAELGFAEVHDLKSQTWLGPLLAQLDDAGRLPCRVRLYPLVEDLPSIHGARRTWERDAIRLGGGKVFTDGTLNSRTAWMLSPYADPIPEHPRGTPMMSPSRIEGALRDCDALGLPLAAHAIGDASVRAVLDAIERVRPRARGQRIEHAELIDERDIPRFADLGVICSVQPCHLLADVEALTRLLPHRLDRVLPLRDLIEAGCAPGELLWFGSDTPIVRPNPEDSVLAATHRRRAAATEREAIAPGQAITPAQAWACFEIAGI